MERAPTVEFTHMTPQRSYDKEEPMTNMTLGWILTLALLASSVTIRAIYLTVVQRSDKHR